MDGTKRTLYQIRGNMPMDVPELLENTFVDKTKSVKNGVLVLNTENNTKVLTEDDINKIDSWIWNHEGVLLDHFGYLDIEHNIIS